MGAILEIIQFDRLLRALCVIVFVKLFSFYFTMLENVIIDWTGSNSLFHLLTLYECVLSFLIFTFQKIVGT